LLPLDAGLVKNNQKPHQNRHDFPKVLNMRTHGHWDYHGFLIFTWHFMVNQGLSPGGREVESLGFNGSSGQAICMEFSHNFLEIHGILARLTG